MAAEADEFPKFTVEMRIQNGYEKLALRCHSRMLLAGIHCSTKARVLLSKVWLSQVSILRENFLVADFRRPMDARLKRSGMTKNKVS